jgi:predicted aconitase with swiveling domain
MERIILPGRFIIKGVAHAEALVSLEPISLWGGYDWQTGEITDRQHDLSGQFANGRILAIPYTRGSSTTTAVLLQAIRHGTAPAAILTTGTDFFFALASVVADELYATPFPLLALSLEDFGKLQTGDDVEITDSGEVIAIRRP